MSARELINDAATINIMTRLASEDYTLPWLAEQTGIEQSELEEELYGPEGLTCVNAIRIALALDTTVPALVEGVL